MKTPAWSSARGRAPTLGRPFEVEFVPETGEFELRGGDGAERVSSVTDFEDVSYVCSPYLPDCLRPERTTTRTNRPFSDFSELAHVAAAGEHTLREEGDTHVVVSGLKIITSQYLGPYTGSRTTASAW